METAQLFQETNHHIHKDLSLNNNIISHAYQSEYAKQFLIKSNLKPILAMGDYINNEYIHQGDQLPQKENAIAYNPQKGVEFTERLIKLAPDLKWKPIKGLNRKGVIDLLERCKIYIDFGNHPGKDRLPREAALCRCLIITGLKGAAKYTKDIPIPAEYKINQDKTTPQAIIKTLRLLLNEYDARINDFTSYREEILKEKSTFSHQIKTIFGASHNTNQTMPQT